jgi:hypothetical protein
MIAISSTNLPEVAYTLSVSAYCTHRNCSLVCEGTGAKQVLQDVLEIPSTLYTVMKHWAVIICGKEYRLV